MKAKLKIEVDHVMTDDEVAGIESVEEAQKIADNRKDENLQVIADLVGCSTDEITLYSFTLEDE